MSALVTLLFILGATVLGILMTLSYLWFYIPSIIIRWGTRFMFYKAGLTVKYTQGQKYRYCYGERSRPSSSCSSLLFIHGFSSSKDMFGDVIRRLPKSLHVLTLDLPGHGLSSDPQESDSVSLEDYVENLAEFVTLTGLNTQPFHLLGTSMGGLVIAIYASKYPLVLDRLTLMCPAMIDTPEETDFQKEVKQGLICKLIPETPKQLEQMLEACFYQKHLIPRNRQILQGSMDIRKPRNVFFNRLFQSFNKTAKDPDERIRLEKGLSNIACPVQIIWGKQDELIHVSGAEHFRSLIPRVERVDLLDNCGHVLTFEYPGKITKYILLFRGEHVDKIKKEK